MKKSIKIVKALGPGIMFAGAAVGGSHLVQSTRAGAGYGFSLIWLILLVNLMKYPFFEFGHRYSAATGHSLVHGYYHLGKKALLTFFIFSIVAAVLNISAVSLITAGLLGLILPIDLCSIYLSLIVISLVVIILAKGSYSTLDRLMKFLVSALAILTVIAVGMAFNHGPVGDFSTRLDNFFELSTLSFVLALMGWMPAPIDVSVWPSIWTVEKAKAQNSRIYLRETLLDFYSGYILTVLLALAFVSLGALIIFGTGTELAASGTVFAGQLVNLYASALGQWSFYLVAAVAFITMFSTTLTTLDGYSRSLETAQALLTGKIQGEGKRYLITVSVLAVTAILIISFLMSTMRQLVDIATIIAFLSAPVFAVLNLKAVTNQKVMKRFLPPLWLKAIAWCGIVFLTLFSVVYLLIRLGII